MTIIPKVGDTVTISFRGSSKTGKVLQVGLYGIHGSDAFALEDSPLSSEGIATERWTYDKII